MVVSSASKTVCLWPRQEEPVLSAGRNLDRPR
jgi:hypothetical protein